MPDRRIRCNLLRRKWALREATHGAARRDWRNAISSPSSSWSYAKSVRHDVHAGQADHPKLAHPHGFRFAVRRTSSALSAPKGVSPYKTADNRRRDGISQIRRKWVSQWPYIAAIVTSEHKTAIGWRVTPVSGLQRPYLAIFGPKSTKMADFDGAKSTYRPAR